MEVTLDPKNIDDYRRFLQIKSLPVYRIRGRQAWFPDEYAQHIGLQPERSQFANWEPSDWLFDYQRAIVNIAIRKRKFAVFADCGLGKSLILLEYAQAAQQNLGNRRGTLIVAPLMVVGQLQQEVERFYGNSLPVERVKAKDLQPWLDGCGGKIGITNYDALNDELQPGRLGALVADESSMLKSHYGKWGTTLIRLGKGLEWKLALTGTPAPNDRIEYANHAVFLDQFPTVNAFLATYFINRGQTDNRWELKPHALRPFYRALSHWSIFLTNPATYGWKDNCESIPPIYSHIHDVPLTDEQLRIIGRKTGELFATNLGGITSRAAMGQIAKGFYKGKAIATNKPSYIKDLMSQWPDESTIVWCLYDDEQDLLAKTLPDAVSMSGKTKYADRMAMIRDFKSGAVKTLISKPKILGFGLNLQVATRQVFSGLQDSYESYYQCVKRSNRYGSTKPLNVHIPITDVEAPMVETVLRKADRVQQDTEEQERLFKEVQLGDWN